MNSFMGLNDVIKFEKNVDIFVENLLKAYPLLTNKKLDYIIRNVGGISSKEELIEQLIYNLMEVAPQVTPQAAPAQTGKPAVPQAQPQAAQSQANNNQLAVDLVKTNFKSMLDKANKENQNNPQLSNLKLTNAPLYNSYQKAMSFLLGNVNKIVDNMKIAAPKTAPQTGTAPQAGAKTTNPLNGAPPPQSAPKTAPQAGTAPQSTQPAKTIGGVPRVAQNTRAFPNLQPK
jgi:hypothetical protein